MLFAILIYESPADFKDRNDPERSDGYWAPYRAYGQVLRDAGVWAAPGIGLEPPCTNTATIKVVDGQSVVQDGPYAEAKEQLGGFLVIDVADLDAALDWAAKCPASSQGAVEVRPVMT